MNSALRSLSRRAHSRHELNEKLKRKLYATPELVEAVLERLLELGLLNDEQYTENFLRSKLRMKPQGFRKMVQTLKNKGLSHEEARTAWNKLELSEESLAEEALQKLQKKWLNLPQEKRKEKIMRALFARGFSSDLIYKLARNREIF
ncbi:MAG: regulatory protein RecX [Patescibacteria group bacterium]